jgi:hypothetical protein
MSGIGGKDRAFVPLGGSVMRTCVALGALVGLVSWAWAVGPVTLVGDGLVWDARVPFWMHAGMGRDGKFFAMGMGPTRIASSPEPTLCPLSYDGPDVLAAWPLGESHEKAHKAIKLAIAELSSRRTPLGEEVLTQCQKHLPERCRMLYITRQPEPEPQWSSSVIIPFER